jgi:hypothetical protein
LATVIEIVTSFLRETGVEFDSILRTKNDLD